MPSSRSRFSICATKASLVAAYTCGRPGADVGEAPGIVDACGIRAASAAAAIWLAAARSASSASRHGRRGAMPMPSLFEVACGAAARIRAALDPATTRLVAASSMRTFARRTNLRIRSRVALQEFARQNRDHAARVRQQIYERQRLGLAGWNRRRTAECCRPAGGCRWIPGPAGSSVRRRR